ncbi:hypothetical protein ABZ746_35080 [Streptomyces sp. NPDC020096]
MTVHHLLPAAMRELPQPWNDVTWERKRRLKELPHTEANEQAALDALTAALSDMPRALQGAWSDESWELFYRFREEAGHQLAQVMPTADLLTREGITDVLRRWAETAVEPVPDWWLEEQSEQIAGTWADSVLSHWAYDVLWWLKQEPRDQERLATVAELCIGNGRSAQDAVILLKALGAPHGEEALLRVVRDDGVSEPNRAWARDRLIALRRPGYDVRGQEPTQGEEPLLPPAVQELPYEWGFGFQWPSDLPETEENMARARAILEACVPVGPVPEPVPAPAWDGDEDEERPAWLEVRSVMSHLMPFARQVTRERMTEALRECALLGIPGAPQDPEGEEAERFVRRWVTWISGWIAGGVFTWLGIVDCQARITPWAMELAEQYARNGVAAEQAVGMLRWHDTVPRSREALARVEADDSLSPELRESARGGLGQEP